MIAVFLYQDVARYFLAWYRSVRDPPFPETTNRISLSVTAKLFLLLRICLIREMLQVSAVILKDCFFSQWLCP